MSNVVIRISAILSGGPGSDGIPAIDKPNFGSLNPVRVHILHLMDGGSLFSWEFSSPLPAIPHRLKVRASVSPDVAWTESRPTSSSTTSSQFQINIPRKPDANE